VQKNPPIYPFLKTKRGRPGAQKLFKVSPGNWQNLAKFGLFLRQRISAGFPPEKAPFIRPAGPDLGCFLVRARGPNPVCGWDNSPGPGQKGAKNRPKMADFPPSRLELAKSKPFFGPGRLIIPAAHWIWVAGRGKKSV